MEKVCTCKPWYKGTFLNKNAHHPSCALVRSRFVEKVITKRERKKRQRDKKNKREENKRISLDNLINKG